MQGPTRATAGAAYGLLALTDTVLAAGPHRRRRARLATKPLLMPALAARVVSSPPGPGRNLALVAQALSWGGDIALLKEGRRSFLTGLGSFLAAHVAYVSACRSRSTTPLLGTPGRRRLLAVCGVAASGMAAAAGRQERALAGPVAAYGLALGTMVTAAAAVDPDQGRSRILAGASLFLLSDTLLGVRTFLVPDRTPLLESAVMATYTAAQWCISDGMTSG